MIRKLRFEHLIVEYGRFSAAFGSHTIVTVLQIILRCKPFSVIAIRYVKITVGTDLLCMQLFLSL